MKNPTKIKVKDKIYKINSDFRVVLECNEISQDENIGDYERALAIIYKLFGEEALNDTQNYEELLEKAQKFISCGNETEESNEQPDMDFRQDEGLIKSSFKYDYNYDPYALEYLHWWDFYNDLCNLSYSEFGSCCILNKVRNLRNYDVSEIKDSKKRQEVVDMKEKFSLKRYEKKLTKEQEESIAKFNELAGIH